MTIRKQVLVIDHRSNLLRGIGEAIVVGSGYHQHDGMASPTPCFSQMLIQEN